MTTTIRSDISGTFGALQNNGEDVLRFGQDNSGQLAGFRNKIINGNFDIWQRGTTLGPISTIQYLADRWFMQSSLDGGSFVAGAGQSRGTFALGQTAIASNPKYYAVAKGSSTGGGGGAYWAFVQRIEGVSALSGKTMTLSFNAATSSALPITVQFIQNFGTGGSPSSDVRFGTSVVNTTTAFVTSTRKTITVNVPSVAGKTIGTNGDDYLGVIIWCQANATVGATTGVGTIADVGTLYLAGVQLEEGSIATEFEDRPIGLELSLCQRYYEKGFLRLRTYSAASGYYGVEHSFSVWKRAAPTIGFLSTGYSNGSGLVTEEIEWGGFAYRAVGTAAGSVTVVSSWTADAEL